MCEALRHALTRVQEFGISLDVVMVSYGEVDQELSALENRWKEWHSAVEAPGPLLQFLASPTEPIEAGRGLLMNAAAPNQSDRQHRINRHSEREV